MGVNGPFLKTSTSNGTAFTMKALRITNQGSSGIVAPASDPVPLISSGGWDADYGRLQCLLAAGASIVDGIEENICWWSRDLMDEQPDFDPTQHLLCLEIDRGCVPSGTSEITLFLAVLGGNPGVGQDGIGCVWSQGSLSADNAGQINAITLTFVGGGDNLEGVRILISFTPLSGTSYELRALGRATRQDLTEDAGPATWGEISTIPSVDLSTLKIVWGIMSRSTDNKSTFTISGARFYTGLCPIPTPDRPKAPARLTKAAVGGPINVCIFGDSISDGVGGSGQSGSNAILPAYVKLWIDGVSQTNYPADPGFMYQLAEDLYAQGYTEIRFFQRALTAQYIDVTVGQYLSETISACYDNGYTPDLIVTAIGTNDGNNTRTQAQVDNFPRQLRNACRRAEWASLKLRWIHLSPLAVVGTHPYIDEIRTHIEAVCGQALTRAYVDCSDLARADTSHPTAASYNTMGARAASRWALLS